MSKDCNSPLHPLARVGIEYFNKGEYWLAHEALEDAWRAEVTSLRDLYKGILQTAVIYYHISQNNFVGALKVYRRSQKWLNKWDPICCGVDVDHLRADLDAAIVTVRRLGAEDLAEFNLYPQINLI